MGSASDQMKQTFNQSEALPRSGYKWNVISMEFLSWFLRGHFARKPVMELQKCQLYFQAKYKVQLAHYFPSLIALSLAVIVMWRGGYCRD